MDSRKIPIAKTAAQVAKIHAACIDHHTSNNLGCHKGSYGSGYDTRVLPLRLLRLLLLSVLIESLLSTRLSC